MMSVEQERLLGEQPHFKDVFSEKVGRNEKRAGEVKKELSEWDN